MFKFNKIMDKERRFGNNITQLRMKFSKYKKSILKKCIELSKLCGVEIFLTLIDAKQNYTFFSSSVPPEEFIQKKLVGEPQKKIIQILTCSDVNFYNIHILSFSMIKL